MRKLTHEEILARQAACKDQPRKPLVVVLDHIRSLHNVGSIFRSADGAGVEKIWLCGITGYPPRADISKTALGAEDHVPWEYREDVVSVVQECKDNGYQIVLLEQMEESVPYHNFQSFALPTCLVVGNEVEGVSDALVPLADHAIDIEMRGLKNSLNVSVAFGIVIYHLSQFTLK